MEIIKETYNDQNMDNIYMVKFEETKDQQGKESNNIKNLISPVFKGAINGYKMIWGNATEYNCDKKCPRDAVHKLTNKLVTQKNGDAGKTWVVEAKFHDKFKNAHFDVSR